MPRPTPDPRAALERFSPATREWFAGAFAALNRVNPQVVMLQVTGFLVSDSDSSITSALNA